MRNPITTQELFDRVSAELNQMIADKETFTAYTVTLKLRAASPTDDIPHAGGVQNLVHAAMIQRMILTGDYTTAQVDFNGQAATQFEPVVVAPIPPIAVVPAPAATAPAATHTPAATATAPDGMGIIIP